MHLDLLPKETQKTKGINGGRQMILKTSNKEMSGVSPLDVMDAISDMVKIYKQTHTEVSKLFPKEEAHVAASNIVAIMMSAAGRPQNNK